jgi:5-hydroxyisourate hydrolase-like protein (transthyretin family)
MKIVDKINCLSVMLVACILIAVSSITGFAQKKTKVRMSVQYVKVMNDQSYLQIQTKAKGEKGYHPVAGLKLTIYQVFGDSTALLGDIFTQVDGSAKFILKELVLNPSDTSGLFEYKVTNEATDQYKAGKKKVGFYDVDLMAEIVTKDSINYVSAHLTARGSDTPISGERLKVSIKRLFRPLQVGKSSYKTNENGSILVAIEEGIPGINGILNFTVMIDDSDDYRTVKTTFEAPVGIPVVATDTFDQRTMWSPPSKTPYYMLIVPNIIIVGIWFTLIMLTFNLYKISKSKIY